MAENDPTQQGGQDEEIKPTNNPRNAAMAEIAQQAHKEQSADLASFNEETGEIESTPATEAPAQAEPEVAAEAPAAPAAEPAPPAPKMLTIVVNGQPIEVEESRILDAGKRTLQKESAADRKLQEAAEAKRQAEVLLAQAQRLSNPDAAHEDQPAPSQDAPQSPRAIDPSTLDSLLENKLYARDATKAAEKFKADFPEIASDPFLSQLAANLEDQRLATAAALGESFGDPFEAYRKHGEQIKKWRAALAPSAPAAAVSDKAALKRTIQSPMAANAKAPAPQAPKVLTTSEQIEAMREGRRQGRAVPHR